MIIQIQNRVDEGGNFEPIVSTLEIEWNGADPPALVTQKDGKILRFVSWRDGLPTYEPEISVHHENANV